MGEPRRLGVSTIVIIAASTVTTAVPARAQEAAKADEVFSGRATDLVKAMALNALRRTRRSLVLGPFVGIAPGASIDPFEGDIRLSFGVALYHLDIPPIPSPQRLVDILKSRARERFLSELARVSTGGAIGDQAARDLADQVWEDIKAEFLLEHRPRRFEKPSFAILAEVEHLFGADAWELGALLAFGLGPVYFGAGPVGHFDGGADLYTAIELGLPIMLSRSLRTPLAHLFVRGDIATTDRDERADRLFGGVRLALDIL
jgi:hypothetical protein